MLKHRILTAIVLIPLVLAGLFFLPSLAFQGVAGLIFLGAAYEWAGLTYRGNLSKKIFVLVQIPLLASYFLTSTAVLYPIALLLWIALIFSVFFYRADAKGLFHHCFLRAVTGWLILTFAFVALCDLQAMPLGGFYILSLFLIIWATDIFAYFVGRRWGKYKLSPISPGKTWIGVLGGLLGALVVGAVLYGVWHRFSTTELPMVLTHLTFWLEFVLILAIVSIFGDLFESMIKRIQGVKDSGTLLPGHGGILDRIDSLLPTLPLFAYVLQGSLRGFW